MNKEWVWTVVTGLSGILLGWLARVKADKKEAAETAAHDTAIDTALKSDIGYIKRGVDDIKIDMKVQAAKIEDIDRRVTRCEESTKSAHKRLDSLENKD